MLSKLSYASTTLITKLYHFKISLLLKIKKKNIFYSFEKFQLIKEISKQIELDILYRNYLFCPLLCLWKSSLTIVVDGEIHNIITIELVEKMVRPLRMSGSWYTEVDTNYWKNLYLFNFSFKLTFSIMLKN